MAAAKDSRWEHNNPNWKGEHATIETGRDRARRKFPVARECEKCGARKTERHHKDGNTKNNTAANIAFLCRKCHMTEDGRIAAVAKMANDTLPKARVALMEYHRSRTHCKYGHPYSPDNVHLRDGFRTCLTCRRNGEKRRYAAAKRLPM